MTEPSLPVVEFAKKYKHLKGINGVYQIRNVINGKIYIGSTSSEEGFARRVREHFKELYMQRHANPHLQSSFNKHGFDGFVFEVLEACHPDECLKREDFYLQELKPEYNIQKYGSAPGKGMFGDLHAFSKSVLCVNTGEIFGSHDEAYRKFGFTGNGISKCVDHEHKQYKGFCFADPDDKEWIEECKAYLASDMFRVSFRAKKLMHINTEKIYRTSTEASEDLGIASRSIRHCLEGIKQTAKGQCFAYIDNPERIQELKKWLETSPDVGSKGRSKGVLRSDGVAFRSSALAAESVQVPMKTFINCAITKSSAYKGFRYTRITPEESYIIETQSIDFLPDPQRILELKQWMARATVLLRQVMSSRFIQRSDGKIFYSIQEAADDAGIDRKQMDWHLAKSSILKNTHFRYSYIDKEKAIKIILSEEFPHLFPQETI